MRIARLFSRNLVTVPRSASLVHAATLMRNHHVGALVVTEHELAERACGIVTDRDLVVQLVAPGVDANVVAVGDVMVEPCKYIAANCDSYEAIETMRREGVRRLVVTNEEGRMLGLLSFDDLVDGLAAEMADLAAVIRAGRERELARRRLMPVSGEVR